MPHPATRLLALVNAVMLSPADQLHRIADLDKLRTTPLLVTLSARESAQLHPDAPTLIPTRAQVEEAYTRVTAHFRKLAAA